METKKRLLSLDFFRGFTVAAMILVNNPGDWGNVYAPLRHADWNGCTPTDLIFPFFVFIVGVSISFALQHYRADKAKHPQAIKKAVVRALKIFGLGLLLAFYGADFTKPFEALANLRIPGVLQRIALVYLVCVFLYLKSSDRAIIFITVLLLAAYWLLLMVVPVPGIGPANLDKETNLGAWLDRALLGTQHLYSQAKTWDPEGVLGTIPAIATGLLGILSGRLLLNKQVNVNTKIIQLAVAGCVLVALGWLLNPFFPINKALWTSSYVLYTGGLGMLVLAFCYWVIDVKDLRWFTPPFVAFGRNAIAVYVASGWLGITLYKINWQTGNGSQTLKLWLYEHLFTPYFSPINASLAYAVTFVLVFYLMAKILYKKNIIIKV